MSALKSNYRNINSGTHANKKADEQIKSATPEYFNGHEIALLTVL